MVAHANEIRTRTLRHLDSNNASSNLDLQQPYIHDSCDFNAVQDKRDHCVGDNFRSIFSMWKYVENESCRGIFTDESYPL
jgi:hypothetical protein